MADSTVTDNRIPSYICGCSSRAPIMKDNERRGNPGANSRLDIALNFANIELRVRGQLSILWIWMSSSRERQMALQIFNGQFRLDNEILVRPCKIGKIEANLVRCDYIDRVEHV